MNLCLPSVCWLSLAHLSAVNVVFDYHNDSRAGIFSLQPFFDEHVCFVFPPQYVPPQFNKFEIGVEFLWFNQAWDPNINTYYEQSKFNGELTGPKPVWVKSAVSLRTFVLSLSG